MKKKYQSPSITEIKLSYNSAILAGSQSFTLDNSPADPDDFEEDNEGHHVIRAKKYSAWED